MEVLAAAGAARDVAASLGVEQVAEFYDMLFRLADNVYGNDAPATPTAPVTPDETRRIEAPSAT